MASHTISGQRWADGTTVSVYPAAAWPDPTQAPSGSAVTTAAVAGGAVTFTGLAENLRYVAYAGGLGVRFVVPQVNPMDARSLRARVDDLTNSVTADSALIELAHEVSSTELASYVDGTTPVDTILAQFFAEFSGSKGGTVKLPERGQFRVTSPNVEIPDKVVLFGQHRRPGPALFQPAGDVCEVIFDYTAGATKNGFLLNGGSGVKGIRFKYQNYAVTDGAPPAYGWTLTTKASPGTESRDGIVLEDLMFLNSPFGWINMGGIDPSGGQASSATQFRIVNVHGQAINRAIAIDHCFDAAYLQDVHAWPYWARGSDAAYTWAVVNGDWTFDFRRMDFVRLDKVGVYAAHKGFKLGDAAGLGVWATMDGCWADATLVPLYIERVQNEGLKIKGGFFNGARNSLLTALPAAERTGRRAVLTTGTDVRGKTQIDTTFYSSRVGALISSNSGVFTFGANHDFASDVETVGTTNGGQPLDSLPLIVTGAAQVDVNGSNGTRNVFPVGPGSLSVRGVPLPAPDEDLAPANFAMGSWSAGAPVGWTATSTAAITQIAGGIALKLDTGAGTERRVEFPVPAALLQRPDVYVIEMDVTPKAPNSVAPGQLGGYSFFVDFIDADDGGNRQWYFGRSNFDVGNTTTVKIRVPWIAPPSSSVTLRIGWAGGSDSTAGETVEVTNLKWYRQTPGKSTQRQVEILRAFYQSARNTGLSIDTTFRGLNILPGKPGSKMVRGRLKAIPPTAGVHAVGDEYEPLTPVAGGFRTAVCTTAGDFAGTPPVFGILAPEAIVRKTADETVNNSAALQNDDHLLFPIAANEAWYVEAFLLAQGASATADFKWGWSGPASATANWSLAALADATVGGYVQRTTALTSSSVLAIGATVSTPGLAGTTTVKLEGVFTAAGTPGTINLQWAQDVATVENSKVLLGSFLRIRRIV